MAIFRPYAQYIYAHIYTIPHINHHVTDNPQRWGRAAWPSGDGARTRNHTMKSSCWFELPGPLGHPTPRQDVSLEGSAAAVEPGRDEYCEKQGHI